MKGSPSHGVYLPLNLSVYTHTYNNPIRLFDPDGRTPWAINALAEPRDPEYQAAQGRGMTQLLKGAWNSIVHNVQAAIEYAPYAAQPASAPPPTPQQMETAREGGAALEEKLAFKDVTPSEELAGALLVGMVEMSIAPAALAEASTAAELSLTDRAKQIHSVVAPATQRRTTIAVTKTTEGTRIVSSSEKRLRPSQRAMLKSGEVEGAGPGHAEVTGVEAAKARGLTPTETGASRPICTDCADYLKSEGVKPVGPLKEQ